jgi:tetratricopeptide (TPR) repeat protein/O-antigen ligase
VIILLVVAVPLVINLRSQNMTDIKDVVLGLGVAVGLAIWLLVGLRQGRLAWATSRLSLLVIADVAWAGVSITYAHYRFAAVSEFGRLVAHLGLFLLTIACLRTIPQVRRTVAAACLASLAVSAYAFAQASGHDFQQWRSVAPGRVFSFLANPTYLGGYIILLMPIAIAAGWPQGRAGESSDERPTRSWPGYLASALYLGAALLMLVSLYLSYTLSGFIGLGLGAAIAFLLVLFRGGRKAARIAIPGGLAAAIALGLLGLFAYRHMPENQRERVRAVLHLRDPYARERGLHWRTAEGLFRESPVVGNGYGDFRVEALARMAAEWYQQAPGRRTGMLVPNYAHNEYLQVLADLGLVGGVLFVAMLASAYLLAVWVFLRTDDALWRRLALGMVVAFTAFFFQNFYGITFRETGASSFFWLWLGVLVLGAASLRGQGQAATLPRLHELRLRRLSLPATLLTAAALAAALAVLGWLVTRPVRASMLVRLAGVYAKQGRFDISKEIARQAVALCPYSALAYYNLAYAEGQLGDFTAAAEHNQRALELLPGNASMQYNLGVTYRKLGKYPEAEARFREAVRLAPTFYENQAALAETLLEEGKVSEAWDYTRRALALAPDNPRVLQFAAKVAQARGDVNAALAFQKQAASLQPATPASQQQLAENLLAAKRYQEALPACRKWVELEPGSARAHFALGFAQYWLGQLSDAKQSFLRALALDPRHTQARYLLAWTYLRSNDVQNGARELAEVIRTAPDSKEGKAALDFVRKNRLALPPPPGEPDRAAPQPLPPR